MIEIRSMELEDIDQILVIEVVSFGTPWPRSAFEDELNTNILADYYVAVEGAVIVGYCGVWHIVDEGHITNVAVHPDHRRRGIGRMLMNRLIEWARYNEVISMTLEVRASNIAAQMLYKSYGFTFSGVRKAYYSDNGEDAWILWLSLSDEEGDGDD